MTPWWASPPFAGWSNEWTDKKDRCENKAQVLRPNLNVRFATKATHGPQLNKSEHS